MNSKSVLLIMIFMAAIINLPAQEKNETLNELVIAAIESSPKIRLLESKLNVVSSRIEQGTNLPDPVLTLGLMNMPTNSFSFKQEPMTGKIIGISQAIPYPSGLSTAAEVKAIDTLIVHQEIIDLKNEIRKNVSNLYYDLRFVRAELELSHQRINLLEQISEVVKTKYEVSEASMQNIIKVEIELTRVRDKIEILYGKENALIADLNILLLRNEKMPIYSEEIVTADYNLISPDEIINIAEENQPNLKGIKLSEQKSELMERQAEYESYPNFNIGVQYTQRDYNNLSGIDYTDFLSIVAGISLPLNYGGKKTAKVNEAKYLQSLYQEKYSSSIQDLSRSINVITAKISELHNRNLLISKTLLPLAKQSLQVALSDYQVGKIDFINVIDAEKEIINVKTDLLKIQTDYDQQIVMLDYLAGSELKNRNSSTGDLK